MIRLFSIHIDFMVATSAKLLWPFPKEPVSSVKGAEALTSQVHRHELLKLCERGDWCELERASMLKY